MSVWEILTIIIAACFVVGVITSSIIGKKKGKSSCGDCSCCPYHCSGKKAKCKDDALTQDIKRI